MTLEDLIERDLKHCRDANRIHRERVKEWNNHLSTKRDSFFQAVWEIFGGLIGVGLLAGLCWLCCVVSGYHWE